jgi:acyl carrier protein phosphodiesterase
MQPVEIKKHSLKAYYCIHFATMNYLAHAFLSFNQPDILAGNMFSDFIKGKKRYDFPPGIQRGIALHRAIDEFTDNHHVTKTARHFFQPSYGLYSAVFMDVVYDHFLAIDPEQFSDASLMDFSQETYAVLDQYQNLYPERFRIIYPYMKEYNWLYNYRNVAGIERSFEGIAHRALYMSESNTAFKLFREHYFELQKCYDSFFASLKAFAFDTMNSL